MKKTLKVAGAVILSVLVIIVALSYLLISLMKGDEVFDTTTDEVEAFKQTHLTGNAALDDYFQTLDGKTETRFAIQDRRIDDERSFSESTYIKDESAFDNQRNVYVAVSYQTDVPDSSPYTVCETCSYAATAVYEYEDGAYTLDTVKFDHDWLYDALADTLAAEYVEPDTLPDSPYFYHVVSNHERTLSFNELSATGYWDKDSENYMLTTPLFSDPVQVHSGIVFGDLFDYATKSTTPGFLRINDDGSLSLYETPAAPPGEVADITNATLLKTFLPK